MKYNRHVCHRQELKDSNWSVYCIMEAGTHLIYRGIQGLEGFIQVDGHSDDVWPVPVREDESLAEISCGLVKFRKPQDVLQIEPMQTDRWVMYVKSCVLDWMIMAQWLVVTDDAHANKTQKQTR